MRPSTLFIGIPVAALVLIGVFGATALVGEPMRRAVILSLDQRPPEQALRLSDAASEAAVFFEERDSVGVTVPWDMTVAELLTLYHLDNNASAREALAVQLGASEDTDRLAKGQSFSFALTVREDVR